MVYLGGQHLHVNRKPPIHVRGTVYKPFNVNRTHAWAVQGSTMKKVYKHLNSSDWNNGHHIDHHLGRIHQRRRDPIYCPGDWLIGQRESKSNISGKTPPDRVWKDASFIDSIDPETQPFIVVLGTHSSGSSCLAGILHYLGVFMGSQLTGYYSMNNGPGGFEAVGLARLCERAYPFPKTSSDIPRAGRYNSLKSWINANRRKAAEVGKVAGGKYPQLGFFGPQLRNICGDNLHVVLIERDLEKSILSLQKRCPNIPPDQLRGHQRILHGEILDIYQKTPEARRLAVSHQNLMNFPSQVVAELVDFLETAVGMKKPNEGQIMSAVQHVHPELNHFPSPS